MVVIASSVADIVPVFRTIIPSTVSFASLVDAYAFTVNPAPTVNDSLVLMEDAATVSIVADGAESAPFRTILPSTVSIASPDDAFTVNPVPTVNEPLESAPLTTMCGAMSPELRVSGVGFMQVPPERLPLSASSGVGVEAGGEVADVLAKLRPPVRAT